jgi:hypothetical protein
MRLRTPASMVVAAVAAAGALATPASAGSTVETNAVFTGTAQDGPGFYRLYGDVEVEGSQKCVPDRKVDLYRKADGPDTFIGRTRSDSFGVWSITIPSVLYEAGTYYVKVLKKTLKNGTVCLPDKSNEIEII